MPNIVIPETFIPCVNDPDLIGASYPLSTLGENLKIEYTSDNVCCPYTKKNQCIFGSAYLLPCFAPIICGIALCYYRSNPEVQISHHVIQGTLCPKCASGKIKYSMIADGECADKRKKELFICEVCKTVYPEFQLSKYFGPNPSFRPIRHHH